MKNKGIVILSIVFFIIINSSYYWEGFVGIWAMPLSIILFICFLILGIAFLLQLFKSISEKFKSSSRTFLLVMLTLVVGLTIYKPSGLINFDKLEGKDLLVAQREGAANCMITLKLKENSVFVKRSVCFGIDKIKGEYSLKNDTIWFSNTNKGVDFHEFGVIRENDSQEIDLYYSINDTIPLNLLVNKNELK